MPRVLLSLALLPALAACRNSDVLTLQQDNSALRADLDEALSRIEALEAESTAQASTLADQQATLASNQEDLDVLTEEVEQATGLDLVALIDDVEDLDARLAAFEEEPMASEAWVVEQNYASAQGLADVATRVTDAEALAASQQTALADATSRITANEQAIAAGVTAMASLQTTVDSQGTALAANSTQLDAQAAESQALRTLAEGTASRVDTVEGDVQGLSADLTDAVAAATLLADRMDTLAADVQANAAAVASTDAQLADAVLDIDALSLELATVQAVAEANEAGLALVQAQADAQGVLIGTFTGRLDDVEVAVVNVGSGLGGVSTQVDALIADVSGLDAQLSTLDGTVSTVQSDLGTLAADVADNSTAISDNAMDITQAMADAAAPRTIQRRMGQLNEPADTGVVASRTLTFTKENDESVVRIHWFDNRRVLGYGYGYWEGLIDGEPCTEPMSMRWWHHSYGSNVDGSAYSDNHYNAGITGYCSATASGPIEAGEHTFSVQIVHQSGNRNDWYMGWNGTTYVVEMEEVY